MSNTRYIERYSSQWHVIETINGISLVSIYNKQTKSYSCRKTKQEYLDDVKRYPKVIPVYSLDYF